MKAVKKNQDFQNELFGFVALTLTLSDFAYFAAIYLTSSRPWLSLGLAALFPAVNVPALKLSVRTGKSYISYTLLLTLIPMFLVTYFSGPQSAAWLMCFSGMFASHVMCHGEHLKKCLVIGFVAAALLGSFSGGSSIAQLGIISVALASYALVSTRIFSFMRTQNEKLGLQITEREAAEMKIRAMSDASHDAMIMINGQGEVMFWNAAAEEMFGYTAEEARGTDMHTLLFRKNSATPHMKDSGSSCKPGEGRSSAALSSKKPWGVTAGHSRWKSRFRPSSLAMAGMQSVRCVTSLNAKPLSRHLMRVK